MPRRWGCGARMRPGGACTSEYGLRAPRPSTCSSGSGVRGPWWLAFGPESIRSMPGITSRDHRIWGLLQGQSGWFRIS